MSAECSAETIPSGYKPTEVGVIPEDWEIESLRCDVTLLSGQHVLAQHCNKSGNGLPYLTGPADFPNGKIQQTKFTSRPTTLCKAGDILVTVKGSGSGTLVEADDSYCISRQLMAIRVKEWNAKFLFYSLLYNASKIKTSSTGLIPGLSRFDILDQEIPLPPTLAEQESIAEALSDTDALIESLEQLIDKKRQIKQGAMQELLTGKKRLPGFGEGKGYKQTEAGVIPEDWGFKQLGDIATIATGNTPPTQDPTNYGDEFMFVSPIDLGFSKYIFHTEKMLSKKGFSVSRPFPAGSVLFVCIGSTIGKCGIALETLTSNQQINAILPSEEMSCDYLYYAVFSVASKVKSLAGEQAVPIVNKSRFSETTISVPPTKAEQTAIATILSDMDSEITALEEKLAKARQIKQGMMQELLTGRVRLV